MRIRIQLIGIRITVFICDAGQRQFSCTWALQEYPCREARVRFQCLPSDQRYLKIWLLSWGKSVTIESVMLLRMGIIFARSGFAYSVADPGCLSRISDPDFYPSRIPDLGSRIQKQLQKRGVKKNFIKHFFVATNFTKCKIILFLNCSRKKFGPLQRIMKLFTQKVVTKLSKYDFGIRDPKSGIRDPE